MHGAIKYRGKPDQGGDLRSTVMVVFLKGSGQGEGEKAFEMDKKNVWDQ